MSNKNQSFDENLKEEFKRAGARTQREVEASGVEHISDVQKERIHAKLREQIAAYEKEKIYAQLSEEDRKALELGKELMRKQEDEAAEKKVIHKKKPVRIYLVIAAAVVMAMAFGVTSIGGPRRIIKMMTSSVGDREVEKVNTNEDNKVIEKEREEEAYQEIKDILGIDPVRLVEYPSGMKYSGVEIDETLLTAEVMYTYHEKNVAYLISANYTDGSWGIDTEDKCVEEYQENIAGVKIQVKRYQINEAGESRYSAKFSYKGSEYYLIGTMGKEDFEKIIKNLYFFSN